MATNSVSIKFSDKTVKFFVELQSKSHRKLPDDVADWLEKAEKFKEHREYWIVPISTINSLHLYLASTNPRVYLHELFGECEIILPEPPIIPRNPELEARIVRLKQEQAEREYQRMTSNIDGSTRHDPFVGSIGEDIKAYRKQMIAVANFVITVGCCFVFGYKATEYAMHRPNVAAQVMGGMVLATFVAIAELYFLIVHLDAFEMGDKLTSSKGGGTKVKSH